MATARPRARRGLHGPRGSLPRPALSSVFSLLGLVLGRLFPAASNSLTVRTLVCNCSSLSVAALGPAVRALLRARRTRSSRGGARPRGTRLAWLRPRRSGAQARQWRPTGLAAGGAWAPRGLQPEPARPALAAAFLTTEPAAKPCHGFSKTPSAARSLPALSELRVSLAPEGFRGAPARPHEGPS